MPYRISSNVDSVRSTSRAVNDDNISDLCLLSSGGTPALNLLPQLHNLVAVVSFGLTERAGPCSRGHVGLKVNYMYAHRMLDSFTFRTLHIATRSVCLEFRR